MFENFRRQAAQALDPEPTADARTVKLPIVGIEVPAPPTQRLTRHGVLAALAALEIANWPITAALAVGHELLRRRPSSDEEDRPSEPSES